MIKGDYSYGTPPDTLGSFMKEHHGHHHVPKKSDTPLQTIYFDHSITAFNIGKRVLQGVTCALLVGYVGYFHKVADKKVIA